MKTGQLRRPVAENDHVLGPADALVTLVEYGDYECPYCALAYPIVKAAQQQLGDQLRFVFRNFPLSKAHPHAQHAAEAAEAAGAQGKFWPMHNLIFEHQHALEDAHLLRYAQSLGLDTQRFQQELRMGVYAKRVQEDFRQGMRSGVNRTPTFFVNGVRYDGLWEDERAFIRALSTAAEAARHDASRVVAAASGRTGRG